MNRLILKHTKRFFISISYRDKELRKMFAQQYGFDINISHPQQLIIELNLHWHQYAMFIKFGTRYNK